MSKITIRTFGKMSAVRMAKFYRDRLAGELLHEEPRWNKDLEMWEYDILKKD